MREETHLKKIHVSAGPPHSPAPAKAVPKFRAVKEKLSVFREYARISPHPTDAKGSNL